MTTSAPSKMRPRHADWPATGGIDPNLGLGRIDGVAPASGGTGEYDPGLERYRRPPRRRPRAELFALAAFPDPALATRTIALALYRGAHPERAVLAA